MWEVFVGASNRRQGVVSDIGCGGSAWVGVWEGRGEFVGYGWTRDCLLGDKQYYYQWAGGVFDMGQQVDVGPRWEKNMWLMAKLGIA